MFICDYPMPMVGLELDDGCRTVQISLGLICLQMILSQVLRMIYLGQGSEKLVALAFGMSMWLESSWCIGFFSIYLK